MRYAENLDRKLTESHQQLKAAIKKEMSQYRFDATPLLKLLALEQQLFMKQLALYKLRLDNTRTTKAKAAADTEATPREGVPAEVAKSSEALHDRLAELIPGYRR